MQDRIPVNPGRVLISPENGAAYYATMARADNATQEGTPLNKNSLLRDVTAAMFGFGPDAVPNDALSFLGKYAQHWWRRRSTSGYTISLANKETIKTHDTTSGSAQVRYSDTVNIGENGALSLNNPATIVVNAGDDTLVGKYFEAAANCSFSSGVIYFGVTAPAWDFSEGEDCKMTAQRVSAVLGNTSEWEIVRSSNRNEYPDSGIYNGYEYQYICMPLENAVTAPKIVTGSYTGTGTTGASSPNSLTFDFEPKFVFVFVKNDNGEYYDLPRFHYGTDTNHSAANYFIWARNMKKIAGGSSAGRAYLHFTLNDKTLSWYCTAYDTVAAGAQLNRNNFVYQYIAIG